MATGIRAKILDQWSYYDYKSTYQETAGPIETFNWAPEDDLRRLSGYVMLESYYRNAAREWLNKTADTEAKSKRREYGDPNLLVQVALSSLLGNRQRIVTEGSIGEEVPQAVAQQKLLEAWDRLEKFQLKVVESERQSVKYGDSVYVLGWDSERQRPRLNVYDPGMYFPVFDPVNQGAEDFPLKIHIAYKFELETDDSTPVAPKIEIFIRRITWELVRVAPVTYSWNTEPTRWNCEYSDAVWRENDINDKLDDFNISDVDYWLSGTGNPEDGSFVGGPVLMDIDFIPVVHVPNTVNLQGHFGDSVLAPVLQILDDIVATDTDIQASSATTGSPPIAVSGVTTSGGVIASYGPGTVFEVGEGSAEVIDTSAGLAALLDLKDALLERLSVNSRTPEALLGRVKPNEVPSGIALALGFAPHTSMVTEMRLVRSDKYDLLLKFVCRLYQANGKFSGEILPSHLVMGSFLPADKAEVMTLVVQLITAKAVSLETAVQMLAEAGYPIEDWVMEIERIQSRDFASASELAALTGNPDRGLEYLGRPGLDTEEEQDFDAINMPPTQEVATAP